MHIARAGRCHVGFNDLRVGPLHLLEAVEALLKLFAVAGAQAGFLALLVLADGAVAAAPAAGGLSAVTFDLGELAGLSRACIFGQEAAGVHTLRCLHSSHLVSGSFISNHSL